MQVLTSLDRSNVVQGCTSLHKAVQGCAKLHKSGQVDAQFCRRLCTSTQRRASLQLYRLVIIRTCVRMSNAVQVCTSLYKSVRGCTRLCQDLEVCRSVYFRPVQIDKMRSKARGGCKPTQSAQASRTVASGQTRTRVGPLDLCSLRTFENRVRPTLQSQGLSIDPKNSGVDLLHSIQTNQCRYSQHKRQLQSQRHPQLAEHTSGSKLRLTRSPRAEINAPAAIGKRLPSLGSKRGHPLQG